MPTLGLVPQRVTATVTREALRLVRLETEHDALLTTPEHPFATPRSGWTHAGRLLPGDWVVSERFGAVRLSSVRNEPAPRPVPVFNLSVAASHAYFVGTARVLVHNTKCQPGSSQTWEEDLERVLRQRDELTFRLTALKKTAPESAEVAELENERKRLNRWLKRLRTARRKAPGGVHSDKPARFRRHHEADLETAKASLEAAQKQLAELTSLEPTSAAERAWLARDIKKLERQVAAQQRTYDRASQILNSMRELDALEKARPTSDADRRAIEERKKALRAELNRERERASSVKYMRRKRAERPATPTSPDSPEINPLPAAPRKERGPRNPDRFDRALQQRESNRDATLEELEGARQELAALERQRPTARTRQSAFSAQKAQLERQIATLQLSYGRANNILSLMRDLAKLEQEAPATQAEHLSLGTRKDALRTQLRRELRRESYVKYKRKNRAHPAARAERALYERNRRRRRLQRPPHLDDPEPPRHTLEHLQDELAGQLQQSPSDSRDARIHHLTDQIETLKGLDELRRKRQSLTGKRNRLQHTRDGLNAKGKDSSEIDQQLEALDRQLHATRSEIEQLRERDRLLARLDNTPWPHAPMPVDEAQLQEFERQLAEGITENELQLDDVEQAPYSSEAPDFDWQEDLLAEAFDVDELLAERDELMGQSPSPERAAGFQSSYERLQQELREERRALEAALSALVNEYAHIQTTQAGSSSGPTWQERLKAIQEEQQELRARWRAGLQAHLDSAQRQLQLLQSIEPLRDREVEAELAREIALLERELQNSG